nr:Cytidine and deoxycytidylate deaminase zinc-binding region [uncultured bacterium]
MSVSLKEDYIAGFEGQPQFRTLKQAAIQKVIDQVNASSSLHKIYSLSYFQREAKHILEKLKLESVVLINGSWQYAFHNLEAYYTLVNRRIVYDMVSPFVDETEARRYEATVVSEIQATLSAPPKHAVLSEGEMLDIAHASAKSSFDYTNQTGVALGKKVGSTKRYKFLDYSFNRVVPFQTYAMHNGASREKHFSPPNDLNHYDTVHAEVELLIQAQLKGINMTDTTLFINVLPCPPCSRMLAETSISELVYVHDHSSSYAVHMLESTGKKVRRIVNV